MKRKRRVGEVICRCGAYRFPHRMMGGRCDGGALVYKTFEEQAWGSCRDCHFRIDDDAASLNVTWQRHTYSPGNAARIEVPCAVVDKLS